MKMWGIRVNFQENNRISMNQENFLFSLKLRCLNFENLKIRDEIFIHCTLSLQYLEKYFTFLIKFLKICNFKK